MSEQNDTLQVVSTAEVIDVYSEGPVVGLWSAGSAVDKYKAVYYDGSPLKSLDVNAARYPTKRACEAAGGAWIEDPVIPNAGYCDFLNYPGTKIEERTGLLDQEALNTGDFSSATTTVNVGARLYHGRPIVRTISNTDVDSVRVVISLPQLFAQVKADIVATTVEIEIAVRAAGQANFKKAELNGFQKFNGKSSSEYRRSYRINLRPFGDPPYDIKVSRVTPDSEKVGTRNETYWHSYNEITNVLLSMPHTAAVKSTIKAEYTGGRFPSVRQFLVLGRIVKVPSNYFTNIDSEGNVTRYTEGVWDGTFKEAWTNNPAWIFYDVVTHTRYSIGDVVVPWMLDKWKLYSIAAQCDQMVKTGRKDGLGNDVMEHRFSASVQLLEPRDALLVIRDMASVFRGMATWHAGGLFVTQDVPSDPVAQYTAANVVNGEFSYTGASRQNRTTAVLVTYLDSNNNYQKVTDCVEAPSSYIERYGYNQTEVVAFACSSRSQAHRLARYILYTSMMEHDIVNFKVGIDSLLAAPGQIVRVVDKNKSDTLAGGRIASVISQTEVILDRDITLEVGHTYTLTCSMPDGTLSSNTVTNAPGVVTKGSVVTLSGPLSAEPVAFAVWTLVSDQSPTVLYRIVGIKEAPIEDKPGHFFEVTATAYDPEKYAQIDDVQEVVLPDLYDPRAEVVPMPEEALFYKGVDSNGRYLDVIWSASTGKSIKEYEVRWVYNDQATLHKVDNLSFRVINPTSGLHEFFITAINVAGIRSQPLYAQYYYENLVELPKVNGLEVKGQGNDATFSGDEVTVVWRSPAAAGSGASALDNDPFTAGIGVEQPELVPVADYLVTTYDADGNKLSDRTAATNAFTYTLDMNRADGGPRRSFIFGVAPRDAYGRVGDETRLLVSNPASKAVSGLLIEPGVTQATMWFTPPTDPDWRHIEVHVSPTPGFTPSAATLKLVTKSMPAVVSELVDGTHYCRIISVDSFGYDASSITSEFAFTVDSASVILDEIRGKVDATTLEQTLSERIGQIDAPGGILETLLTHSYDLAEKGQAIAALESAISDPISGLNASATAISALDNRVDAAEVAISSNASSITALQTAINDPISGLNASATAISALDNRVDAAEGAISSNASSITALSTTVEDHTASLTVIGASVDGLSAQYTVKVDVDGVVAGIGLAADANSSEFAVRADKISFLAGGSTWTPSTAKGIGDSCIPTTGPAGISYVAKTAGTTGRTEPTWPTVVGNLVVDGTVTWEAVNARPFRIEGGKTYIDTALIADASISSAQISNISASKISTGSLLGHTITLEPYATEGSYLVGGNVDYSNGVGFKIGITPEGLPKAYLGRHDGVNSVRYIRDWLSGSSVEQLNKWIEIQAYTKDNKNVALGKTVTGNYAANASYPYSRITNGYVTWNSYAMPSTYAAGQYVTVDLGAVYDIEEIVVWHYFLDNRVFSGTKLEVSEDGVTWTTVFDSAVSGTYAETENGKSHVIGKVKTYMQFDPTNGLVVDGVKMQSVGELAGGALKAASIQGPMLYSSGTVVTRPAGDTYTTLFVKDTSEFPSSGQFIVNGKWADKQVVNYTGKTANSFTGCYSSGPTFPVDAGAIITQVGAASFLLDSGFGVLRMYADSGTGTIEEVVSIGRSYYNWGTSATIRATHVDGPAIQAFTSTGKGLEVFSSGGGTGISVTMTGSTKPGIDVSSDGLGVRGYGRSYDFYASGPGTNYGPFTGGHDGLMLKGESAFVEQGDIVADGSVFYSNGLSQVIGDLVLSSHPNDCKAIGVFNWSKPIDVSLIPAGLDGRDDIDAIAAEYDLVSFNAIGEGKINVCGENGPISAGDLIVTSSLPGKGMRQSDNIVRNYTVAKARESVTFSSQDEVKQIACIYLCG